LAEQRFKDIMTRLKTAHRFPLTAGDEKSIRRIYMTFAREGVRNFYSSFRSPGYATLMTLTDDAGKNWSYLASRENYERVRALQIRNLIVPLVGDFAGSKAIRLAGKYVRDHGATVHAFYISNVEDYIQRGWPAYVNNIASLPVTGASVFIRWSTIGGTSVAPISGFLRAGRRRVR
jgi:hypothetical protein